jgi:hypothetical protein
MMADRFQDCVCGVCAGLSSNIGLVAGWMEKPQALFVCEDMDCLKIAKRTVWMNADDFNAAEKKAAREAMLDGCEFLDKLGVSSFSELSEEQMYKLSTTIIEGYRKNLKTFCDEVIPF